MTSSHVELLTHMTETIETSANSSRGQKNIQQTTTAPSDMRLVLKSIYPASSCTAISIASSHICTQYVHLEISPQQNICVNYHEPFYVIFFQK